MVTEAVSHEIQFAPCSALGLPTSTSGGTAPSGATAVPSAGMPGYGALLPAASLTAVSDYVATLMH